MNVDWIREECGTMLPMTAGLVFVAFAVTALVVEIALLGSAYRDLATVADLAAESGASIVAISDAYDADVSLDVVAAAREAERVAGMWGSGDESVRVDVDPTTICVTIVDGYRPRTLVFLGITELSIEATGCAAPRAG